MPETATISSWKNIPIDDPKRIEISLHFTESEFQTLTKGLIPKEMEDKWFIFFEDSWLYFHRSWTGFGVYKAEVIRESDGYSIREFWVERNSEKYSNTDDLSDVQKLTSLISRNILGRKEY